MSGGSAVTGRCGGRGITRFCTTEGRKNGDTPRDAPKGLGLDGQGAAGPVAIERESAEGCHSIEDRR